MTERYTKSGGCGPQDELYFARYRDLLLPHVIGPKVFDIGCGEGWLTAEIARLEHVAEVFAIDRYAGAQQEHPKIRYMRGDIPGDLPTWRADTVISTEFVEHITQAAFMELCRKVRRMLAEPWAWFLGSTPNRMVPTTNSYHLREYTIDELNDVLQAAGFTRRYLWHIRDLTVFKVR